MSRWRTEPVEYHCSSDCQQMGCPGHVMVAERCRSTDTTTVFIDGKPWITLDDEQELALEKVIGQQEVGG
jgi:hypothetical protein